MRHKIKNVTVACCIIGITLTLVGCRQNSSTSAGETDMSIGDRSDSSIEVSIIPSDESSLSLYFGDKKWGSGLVKAGEKTVATVEASDQIELENGGKGEGIVFTTARGGITGKQYLHLASDGELPSGDLIVRKEDNIVQTADKVVVADLRLSDGASVPVSLALE